jgi:curved DNA-binding protein CbpA
VTANAVMSNYSQDYRTLGVEPGCSVQSLKFARRRLVKLWHPDHFSAPGDKHQAEHRIKEINTAFDRLIDYYRTFGVLPNTTTEEPAPAPTVS